VSFALIRALRLELPPGASPTRSELIAALMLMALGIRAPALSDVASPITTRLLPATTLLPARGRRGLVHGLAGSGALASAGRRARAPSAAGHVALHVPGTRSEPAPAWWP
jgi:hypothetical protein